VGYWKEYRSLEQTNSVMLEVLEQLGRVETDLTRVISNENIS